MASVLGDSCLLLVVVIVSFEPASGHRPAQARSARATPAWDLSADVHGLNWTENQRFPRVSSQRPWLDGVSAVQRGSLAKDDGDVAGEGPEKDVAGEGPEKVAPYDKRAWMMVAVSATSAGIAVILTAKIGECLAAPSKRVPTEADKIEEELQEAKARAEELTQALKDHYDAQRAQEGGEQAPASALDALSNQELLGGMHFRSKYFQKSLDLTVDDINTQTAPLMAKGARIQDVFLEEVGAIKEKAAKFAQQEAEDLMAKMRNEVADDLANLPSFDPNALDGMGMSDETRKQVTASIPAFGLLIAGTFAPAQLQGIAGNAGANILLNGFLCATAVGLAAAGWKAHCKDHLVFVWLHGVVGVSMLLVLSNSAIRARASSALQVLQDARNDNKPNTGNSVWDTFYSIKNSSPFLLKALFVYDGLTRSCIYSLNQIAGLVYLIWGGFGVYVSMANIVEDTLECDAKGAIAFMHLVSFVYVLLFTWSLITLVVWLVMLLSSSSLVSSAILKFAMSMDDEQDHGIPICVTLVKSFVLRSSVDMIQVQKAAIAEEIQKLEQEAQECEASLQRRRADMSELEAQEQAAVADEDALIEKYTAQVHTTLDTAKPLITLAAISQQAGYENAEAAMAALGEQAQVVAADLGQQAQDLQGQAAASLESAIQQTSEAMEGLQQQMDQHAPMLEAAQQQAAAAASRLQAEATPVLAAAQEQLAEQAPSAAAAVGAAAGSDQAAAAGGGAVSSPPGQAAPTPPAGGAQPQSGAKPPG